MDDDIVDFHNECECEYNFSNAAKTHSKSNSVECVNDIIENNELKGAIKNSFTVDNSLFYSSKLNNSYCNNINAKCKELRPEVRHKNCNKFILESSF